MHYYLHVHEWIFLSATPVSFIITSSGDVTVGSLFQLTCTVMGVVVDALIFWFGPRGQIGSSTDEIELGDIVQIGDMYSRTLTFNSLSAEQAGNYTCFNTATVSPSIQHYVFVASKLYHEVLLSLFKELHVPPEAASFLLKVAALGFNLYVFAFKCLSIYHVHSMYF